MGGDSVSGRCVPPQPLTRQPTVSVVIPCYNYGRFLASATESVISQNAVNVEVLIIDDCSNDGSRLVAEGLAELDSRIRIVLHERNLGHIATFNEGIKAVEGDYLVLLSADDLLAPGSLARAAAFLEAHPSVGFVYGDPVVFQTEPRPTARETVDGWTIWHGWDWIAERCRLGANVACSPEVVMRTSVQREIGGYLGELPHTADMEMWLRAATVADVGRIEGAHQAFYRKHGESMSDSFCVGATADLRARHDAFASVLASSTAPGAGRLYRQACRVIAISALKEAFDILRQAHYGNLISSSACEASDELESFALETFPEARSVPKWRHLRDRWTWWYQGLQSPLIRRGYRINALLDHCMQGDE